MLCTTFPIHQIARNVAQDRAGVNLQLMLPAGMGYVVEAFGANDMAYRIAFAALGLGLMLGAAVYLRSRDSATATAS